MKPKFMPMQKERMKRTYPTAVAISKKTVKASDVLKLHLGGAGGTAIRFKKL